MVLTGRLHVNTKGHAVDRPTVHATRSAFTASGRAGVVLTVRSFNLIIPFNSLSTWYLLSMVFIHDIKVYTNGKAASAFPRSEKLSQKGARHVGRTLVLARKQGGSVIRSCALGVCVDSKFHDVLSLAPRLTRRSLTSFHSKPWAITLISQILLLHYAPVATF